MIINNASVNKYLNQDCKSIEGWLHGVSKSIIPIINEGQQKLGVKGDAVEIGCWHGLTLLLLDKLLGDDEVVDGFDIEIKKELMDNIKKFGSKKCYVHQTDTTKINGGGGIQKARSGINKIRLFHVDGYHTFNNAYNDLKLAIETTDRTGIIMLDDFFSCTLPGVTEALYFIFNNNQNSRFFPFAIGGAKCYLCDKDYIGYYRDLLFDNMPVKALNSKDVSFMFGNEVAIYQLY